MKESWKEWEDLIKNIDKPEDSDAAIRQALKDGIKKNCDEGIPQTYEEYLLCVGVLFGGLAGLVNGAILAGIYSDTIKEAWREMKGID